jgi:hypothetical protein
MAARAPAFCWLARPGLASSQRPPAGRPSREDVGGAWPRAATSRISASAPSGARSGSSSRQARSPGPTGTITDSLTPVAT